MLLFCKLQRSTGFPRHLVKFPNMWFLFCSLDVKSTGDKENEDGTDKRVSSREFLPPLDRFRCGVGYLSVSDLTAQFWCEQQMEYNFIAPKPRSETEQMKLGKSIHLARGMQLFRLKTEAIRCGSNTGFLLQKYIWKIFPWNFVLWWLDTVVLVFDIIRRYHIPLGARGCFLCVMRMQDCQAPDHLWLKNDSKIILR